MTQSHDSLRNVGIIAHVDHGKTTLVDAMLRQAGAVADHEELPERALDSMDQERERGITILAKNTAVRWGKWRLNIVDTPGHADFGGEVERSLRLVDGTLLLVDAAEGPMPQTRFVLRKSLQMGHRPLVVISKMDRRDARPLEVVDAVFDLFAELGATDEQLDFPVVYCSGRAGWASLDPERVGTDLRPLFAAIVEHVPAPRVDCDGPLQLQVATIDHDQYVGRIAIGRITRGRIARGTEVVRVPRKGEPSSFRITRLQGFAGLRRTDIDSAQAGDIVALAGVEEVTVGETLCDPAHVEPLPDIPVEPPTVSMVFLVNDSPFAGQEGEFVTSRHLKRRLWRQTERDVSLRVQEVDRAEALEVSGRGVLHLGVLIEQMRREGYELQVSRPHVITRRGPDGSLQEPYEELEVEVAQEHSGAVIEVLNQRGGTMRDMQTTSEGTTRLCYVAPSRALIGLRSELLTRSRGTAVVHSVFSHYGPWREGLRTRTRGVLIAQDDCTTVAYALYNLQERGTLCCGPGERVYHGQIIGIRSRPGDLVVNPAKAKQLTNMRAAGSDDALHLVPPRRFGLEDALEFIEDDELVEVTPRSIRLRKRILDHSLRRKQERRVATR